MGLLDRVKNAQQQAAGAMAGAGGIGGMTGGGDMQAQMAAAQLANKLGAQGVEASGVIRAIRPSGETDMGGGQRTEVDVTIAPDGGSPYDTTVTQSFLPAQLEGLAPGGVVTVKYDPDNPPAALLYGW
ncbi:MAG TPA: hypothetical protein VGF81_09240 [Solirubrobacteraceae bacterium]|jgi:hypothetical protein